MKVHALRHRLLALLLVVPAAVTGGIAAAVWSGYGSATGSGATGTNVAVTLSPGTPSNALHPSASASVALVASNPNASIVHIGSLALDTSQGTAGFAVDAGHAGCAVSTLTFTTQTNGGTGWTVPARVGAVNGTLGISLSGALAMDANAANSCQGATFTAWLVAGP